MTAIDASERFSFTAFTRHPFFTHVNQWLVDRVVRPAKEVVVDLGCGPGAVTRLIVERLGRESGAEVIGVDPSPSALQRARADIAARCTHMGPAGSGLVAKMLNQLIVGCLHSVMAEAAAMAEAAGIDAARLPECLAGGHADGTLLQRLYPRMVARDFAPQGYARQLRKDLEMVNDYAAAIGTPAPMLQQSLALYRRLVESGHAELDTSAVFKLYEERKI